MKSLMACLAAVLLTATGFAQSESEDPKRKAAAVRPWLGFDTRGPTAGEAYTLDLPRGVRTQGRIITAVATPSPAATAGLVVGDIVMKLDANDLYSRDDIRDFAATSRAGRKVIVSVKRGKPLKVEKVALTVGRRALSEADPKDGSFRWDYSGIAQLEAALELARKKSKLVLVGLSGADT